MSLATKLTIAASAFIAATIAVSTASAKPSGPNSPNHQFMPTKKPLIGSNPITWSPNKPLIGSNPITWSPKKSLIGGNPISWTPKKPIDPHFGCKFVGPCYPDWVHHNHRSYWWPTIYPYPVQSTVVVPGPTRIVGARSQTFVGTAPRAVGSAGNCLTKQYMQDGSLLFKDVCTTEFAVATPEQLKAEAEGMKAPQ